MRKHIMDFNEIKINNLICVVDKQNVAKLFLVMRASEGDVTSASKIYGYFVEDILKNPMILSQHITLQEVFCFQDQRVSEYLFVPKDEMCPFLASLDKAISSKRQQAQRELNDQFQSVDSILRNIQDQVYSFFD